jgi:hypothetical protein
MAKIITPITASKRTETVWRCGGKDPIGGRGGRLLNRLEIGLSALMRSLSNNALTYAETPTCDRARERTSQSQPGHFNHWTAIHHHNQPRRPRQRRRVLIDHAKLHPNHPRPQPDRILHRCQNLLARPKQLHHF